MSMFELKRKRELTLFSQIKIFIALVNNILASTKNILLLLFLFKDYILTDSNIVNHLGIMDRFYHNV